MAGLETGLLHPDSAYVALCEDARLATMEYWLGVCLYISPRPRWRKPAAEVGDVSISQRRYQRRTRAPGFLGATVETSYDHDRFAKLSQADEGTSFSSAP